MHFYLTTYDEINTLQSNYTRSIGGYISSSLLYPWGILDEDIGIYSDKIRLYLPDSSWSEWESEDLISIGNEIIKSKGFTDVYNPYIRSAICERYINNKKSIHLSGDIVTLLHSNLFNDVFNDKNEQYRCVAFRNDKEETLYNVFLYVNHNSQNPYTNIKVAIETPSHQYVKSTSDDWDSMSITDASLIDSGLDKDNICKDSYLKILDGPNQGQQRIINSYDLATGKIIFYNALTEDNSEAHDNNIEYEIYPAPSQRVLSGTISPDTKKDKITEFKDIKLDVNSNGILDSISMNYQDVFYVWLKREVSIGQDSYNMNNISLSVTYSKGT